MAEKSATLSQRVRALEDINAKHDMLINRSEEQRLELLRDVKEIQHNVQEILDLHNKGKGILFVLSLLVGSTAIGFFTTLWQWLKDM